MYIYYIPKSCNLQLEDRLSLFLTEPIDIEHLYQSKNVILVSSDFEKPEIINENPFYSIFSSTSTLNVNAVTRGDVKRLTSEQVPKPQPLNMLYTTCILHIFTLGMKVNLIFFH